MAAERESGQCMDIDKLLNRMRPPGSFAEVCLICPVPGVNTPQTSQHRDALVSKWTATNASDVLWKILYKDISPT